MVRDLYCEVGQGTRLLMAVAIPVGEKGKALVARDELVDADLGTVERASGGACENVVELEFLGVSVLEVGVELELRLDKPLVKSDGIVVEFWWIRNDGRGRGRAARTQSLRGLRSLMKCATSGLR